MFKIFRIPEPGEFIVVGGDCSQGGDDSNESHFLSKNKLDFPIIYRAQGVAANMTDAVQPFLEWIYDKTGIPPVVAFERNNGGASEMERMEDLNRHKKYKVFVMPKIGTNVEEEKKETNDYGWSTNTATRPKLCGDWKDAVDKKLVRIYDEETISQHKTFIVKNGKPQASSGSHDDGVIAPAVAWQLYEMCEPEVEGGHTPPPDDTTWINKI